MENKTHHLFIIGERYEVTLRQSGWDFYLDVTDLETGFSRQTDDLPLFEDYIKPLVQTIQTHWFALSEEDRQWVKERWEKKNEQYYD